MRLYIYTHVPMYSPIRRQWCVGFNRTAGMIEGLEDLSWYNSKLDAITECIQKTEFRLGFVADCTNLYKYLDQLNKLKTKLEHRETIK